MQFCLDGANGNNLVYERLLSASDTSMEYLTSWILRARLGSARADGTSRGNPGADAQNV